MRRCAYSSQALTLLIMSETSAGPSSSWTPYFAVLPAALDSLVFWTTDELAELQASSVLQKIGRHDAEVVYQEAAAKLGLPVNMELFHRTASIIMAYAFDIPSEDNDDEGSAEDGLVPDQDEESTTLAMIPLADMLNSDAGRNNARLSCDKEELEMRTIKPIRKGEEIFNDYGPLPSSDLLRKYGYVTPNYATYDVVELSTGLIRAHLLGNSLWNMEGNVLDGLTEKEYELRLELAMREDVYEESFDICHQSADTPSISNELIATIFLLLASDEAISSLKSGKSLPSRSKMTTGLVGVVLKQLLSIREQEYTTSLEHDEKLLQAGTGSLRLLMAVRVRVGEKRVLREAMREALTFQGSNIPMRGFVGTKLAERIVPPHVSRKARRLR